MSRFPQLGERSAYEILGLAPDATEDQIKAAHRRLTQKHHPDHNQDDVENATRDTTLINAARDVLLHDRAAHDARWAPPEPATPSWDGFSRYAQRPRSWTPPPPARSAPDWSFPGTAPPREAESWTGAPADRWAASRPPLRWERRRGRRWQPVLSGLVVLGVLAGLAALILPRPWSDRETPAAAPAVAVPLARVEVPLPYAGTWSGRGEGAGRGRLDLELVIVAGREPSRAVYSCGGPLVPVRRTDTSITFLEQAAADCPAGVLRVTARREGELVAEFCADEPCREITWTGVLRER